MSCTNNVLLFIVLLVFSRIHVTILSGIILSPLLIKLSTVCYHRTWRNSQIGENVILQLEEQSSHVAREKQDAIGDD